MNIPILILSKERPLQLRDMIESIEKTTDPQTYTIYVCDNNSTQPEMIDYLKEIENRHIVIKNKTNNLLEGLNPAFKLITSDYFVISDPDIRLNDNIPKNWLLKFVEILENLDTPKVGMALNLNFGKENRMTKKVIEGEKHYWKDSVKVVLPYVDDVCYWAPIDSTLAMYRHDTYCSWTKGNIRLRRGIELYGIGILKQQYNPKYGSEVLRVAGRYTAEHMGWYLDEKYNSDYEYYTKNSETRMSSVLTQMKDCSDSAVYKKDEKKYYENMKRLLPQGFGPDHPQWKIPSLQQKYFMLQGVMFSAPVPTAPNPVDDNPYRPKRSGA